MFALLVCIKSETLSSFQHFTSWIWSMHFLQQKQRQKSTILTLPTTSTTATWQTLIVGIKDNTQKVSPCHVALSNLKWRKSKERWISCWLRKPNYNGILLSFFIFAVYLSTTIWIDMNKVIMFPQLDSPPNHRKYCFSSLIID